MAGPVDVSPAVRSTADVGALGARDRGVTGVLLAAGLCLGTAVLSLGAAGPMQLAFPLVAVLAALWLLVSRRPHAYLALTLSLWLVAPLVRRIVDWQSSYHEFSVITATPALVSLLAVPWVLGARRRLHRDVAVLFGVVGVVLTYAFAVGVLRNGLVAAAADAPLIIAPFMLGLFVLTVPEDSDRVRALLPALAAYGAIVLGGYAVVQFLVMPPWDAEWMVDSGVGNLGRPEPGEARAFGTLGTASYLGQVLAAMLLVVVAERRVPLQLLALGTGLAGLGVTQSRQGWLVLVVGVVVLLVLGRVRVWRLVGIGAGLFVVLAALGSPVVEQVSDRIEETRTEGAYDDSLMARYAFQTAVAPQVLGDFDGAGLGATGRAALVSGGSHLTTPQYVSFDSGVFESLVRYGSVAGLVLLGTLAAVGVSVTIRSRRGTLLDAVVAAGIIAMTFGMLFQDTQRGVFGVMLWTLLAVAGRVPGQVTAGRAATALRADPRPRTSPVPPGR